MIGRLLRAEHTDVAVYDDPPSVSGMQPRKDSCSCNQRNLGRNRPEMSSNEVARSVVTDVDTPMPSVRGALSIIKMKTAPNSNHA
jgi:hypothetical protein